MTDSPYTTILRILNVSARKLADLQAAYERAAAHVRTLKRDWWRLLAAPEIVVEECAVAIEKLMTQEQPR